MTHHRVAEVLASEAHVNINRHGGGMWWGVRLGAGVAVGVEDRVAQRVKVCGPPPRGIRVAAVRPVGSLVPRSKQTAAGVKKSFLFAKRLIR